MRDPGPSLSNSTPIMSSTAPTPATPEGSIQALWLLIRQLQMRQEELEFIVASQALKIQELVRSLMTLC